MGVSSSYVIAGAFVSQSVYCLLLRRMIIFSLDSHLTKGYADVTEEKYSSVSGHSHGNEKERKSQRLGNLVLL